MSRACSSSSNSNTGNPSRRSSVSSNGIRTSRRLGPDPPQQQQQKTATRASEKKRIMVVDDEADITLIVKSHLERHGMQVSTFTDPVDALSRFKPGQYDLLIVDIRMPGMNGFEFYRRIKNVDQQVKVCFLTAFELIKEELERYFPALDETKCSLNKPIRLRQLLATIDAVFDNEPSKRT